MRRSILLGLLAALLATEMPVIAQSAANVGARLSAAQLDNLLAPVALYPDPLLAQILPASSYPGQIAAAEKWVQAGHALDQIHKQSWDVSVQAVAHYPAVLLKMNRDPNWTTTLGQAYAAQPHAVMESIQRLRQEARAQGNLKLTGDPGPVPRRDQVLLQDGFIEIVPLAPEWFFVPVYDPFTCFSEAGFPIVWGPPFPIGPWLIYDFNWPYQTIYYTGWMGGGWIARSRPFVHPEGSPYLRPRYQRVAVNRQVLHRRVNLRQLNALRPVHRRVSFLHLPAHAVYRGARPGTAVPARRARPRRMVPQRPPRVSPQPRPMPPAVPGFPPQPMPRPIAPPPPVMPPHPISPRPRCCVVQGQ